MTERELFIDWVNSKYSDFNTFDTTFNESENCFNHMPTQARWEAWQAATQREGFKFVPVEASEKMIESADQFGHVEDIYRQMIGAIDD